ncbi:MAG: tyrosine-type recombinase/integrase [Pseudomonadota bacterium]
MIWCQRRHTFASWLVMEGVPLFEVSKLLRHAGVQIIEWYAHLAPDHLHDTVASIKFSAHQLGVPTPIGLSSIEYIVSAQRRGF